jgi:hypothetical protein
LARAPLIPFAWRFACRIWSVIAHIPNDNPHREALQLGLLGFSRGRGFQPLLPGLCFDVGNPLITDLLYLLPDLGVQLSPPHRCEGSFST